MADTAIAEADDWKPVGEQPEQDPGDWQPVSQMRQQEPTPDFSEPAARSAVGNSPLGYIWRTFSHGFDEYFGSSPLGMSPDDVAFMQKHGIFRNERDEGAMGVVRAFNESVLYRGAQVLDGAWRYTTGLYGGISQVLTRPYLEQATGQPIYGFQGLREIASAPESLIGVHVPAPGEAPAIAERLRKGEEVAKLNEELTDAYHGTASEEDFGTQFDLARGLNKSEQGVAFFSPTPALAESFSSTNIARSERVRSAMENQSSFMKSLREKYGSGWRTQATTDDLKELSDLQEKVQAAQELPSGAAFPRIIPVKIRPGKTETFDVSKLFGSGDEEFNAALREVNTNPDIGATPPIYQRYSAEERQSRAERILNDFKREYDNHEKRRAEILRETTEEGEPVDIGPWQVPLGTNAIAAVIQLAKRRGLDTARITNLAEGGEQILALNPKNIISRFSPSLLTPSDLARARELGVVGPEKPSIAEGTPAEAAANAIQPTVAFHWSPASFEKFGAGKSVFEGEIGYMGNGFYVASSPENAGLYRDFANKSEAFTGEGNLYTVRVHADPEKTVDMEKPFGEQPAFVQKALAPLIEGKKPFEAFGQKFTPEGTTIRDLASDYISQHDELTGGVTPHISNIVPWMQERGIEAIRHDAEVNAEGGFRGKKSQGDIVVFDPNHLEITHKNGEPVAPEPSSPQRAAAATRKDDPDNVLRGPEPNSPAVDKAGNIRLDLIETSDDAKNVIRQAAEDNGEFMGARRGEIPLAHVEALSQATGVPLEEMTPDRLRGMGRLMRNDDEVRTAITAMIQSAEDVAARMKQAALTDRDEDLIAFQEARMRHAVVQEQVAGLTAEWGRTGNVFQEFRDQVKDAKSLGDFLRNKKGQSIDDLRNMVRAGSTLDPRTQLPAFLHASRSPTFFDKFLWYWTNSLISGPITHLKYIGANAAFAGFEHGVVTPVAAAIGKGKQLLTGAERERVLGGEAMAGLWGMVAGTPDAFVAAWKAAASGLQTPLPGQLKLAERLKEEGLSEEEAARIRKLIDIPQNRNPFTQQKPIGGAAGTVIGIPSRGAAAIHSFYNFLGYRAMIEQLAYRKAAREGLSPTEEQFWQRRAQLADDPADDMMEKGIEGGYRLTFITELGPKAKAVQRALNQVPALKLIVPFMHIPVNLFKRGYEMTPAAFLDRDMRDALFGRKGSIEQDKAVARVIAGSALMAWVGNMVLNDRATGDGPTDPNERRVWLLTHQPNSIRIGDSWVSFNRFGPIGDVINVGANASEVLAHKDPNGEEASQIAVTAVQAASRMIEDEVGMQGLVGLLDAVNDPKRYGARYVGTQASTVLPFSSLLRQTAAFRDPYVRNAKSIIDSFKVAIPGVRETMLPKRDIFGNRIDNAAYHSILRTRAADNDPVALEMQALGIHPALPQDRVGGVKLTPQLYDEYQATAGPLTRTMLDAMVAQPQWKMLPDFVREQAIRNVFRSSRASAAAAMQAYHPALIQTGIQQRMDHIRGVTHTARPANPPDGLQ